MRRPCLPPPRCIAGWSRWAYAPLAIVEAKNNSLAVGDGMQEGLGYADMLDVPFVFSSKGDGFLQHGKTARAGKVEREVTLDEFPAPEELWNRYCSWKNLTPATEAIVTYETLPGKVSAARHQVLAPSVQRCGTIAVLAVHFVSRGGGDREASRNCTEAYRREAQGWRIIQTRTSPATPMP